MPEVVFKLFAGQGTVTDWRTDKAATIYVPLRRAYKYICCL